MDSHGPPPRGKISAWPGDTRHGCSPLGGVCPSQRGARHQVFHPFPDLITQTLLCLSPLRGFVKPDGSPGALRTRRAGAPVRRGLPRPVGSHGHGDAGAARRPRHRHPCVYLPPPRAAPTFFDLALVPGLALFSCRCGLPQLRQLRFSAVFPP